MSAFYCLYCRNVTEEILHKSLTDMLISYGQPLCNGSGNSENICGIIVNILIMITLVFSITAENAGKFLLLGVFLQ